MNDYLDLDSTTWFYSFQETFLKLSNVLYRS